MRFPEDVPRHEGPWPVPPEEGRAPEVLSLRVADAPVPARFGFFELHAWLANESESDAKVIVFPVGPGGFHAELVLPPEVRRKSLPPGPPMPAPVPPPPMSFVIPPRSEVRFAAPIDVGSLVYEGTPEVAVRWTFHFWTAPRPSGSLSFVLPSRGAPLS